jgi:predicted  nucleic acid-binding Zn-ribbon protein
MVLPPSHMHQYSHSHTTTSSCPSCGNSLPNYAAEDSRRRIRDLEAQVDILNSRAAAAADKIADYEDEMQFLRAANSRSQQYGGPPQQPDQNQSQTTRLASLGNYLMRKRNPSGDAGAGTLSSTTPTSTQPPLHPLPGGSPQPASHSIPSLPLHGSPSTSTSSPVTLATLHSTLEQERELRQRAEESLKRLQAEVEDLSQSLFTEANEMVAVEKKERHKLEERVKALEIRDKEKKGRLERLEERVKRVERVRGMLR